MSHTSTQVTVNYFGKVPSRDDFVKAGSSLSLLTSLDNWVARSMDNMTTDARWKNIYDEAQPFSFAFLGPRSKLAIGGHFVPSRDSAQRRFPFVTASALEVGDPAQFAVRSPLVFSRLWHRMGQLAQAAIASTNATPELNAIPMTPVLLELQPNAYDANMADFLELQTVSSLESQLRAGGFTGNCRQLVLRLVLLLQPVMASGSARLDKSLCLPLPQDPMYQYLTAAFWMSLVNPFLQRADFELSLYITHIHQRPTLVVGFNGASPTTLEAVLNPQAGDDHFVSFDDANWVEESVTSDYGVAKLSSYLEQSRFSLAAAKKSFNEVFQGA